MKKQVLQLWIVLLLAALCGFGIAEESAPADAAHHITILATSDLHGNILGYSYEDDRPTNGDGMARLTAYIQKVRAENPNTLLIDGGDAIQGTIMTDDLYNKNPDAEHPVIAAMNAMGYDAMVLGNHEFDWGVSSMMKILGQADFPILADNVRTADGALLTGSGWILEDVDGVEVAIIGVVTPFVPMWDGAAEGMDALTFAPVAESAERAIEEIGDRADVIVVSAHTGLNPDNDRINGTDAASAILERSGESVDVLQCAHQHVTLCEDEDSTVIGEVRNAGVELVRFDLYLDEEKDVIARSVEIIPMEGIAPDESIGTLDAVAKAHADTRALVAGGAVLGTTTARFQPRNEINGLPAGRLMDTAVIDLINKVQMDACGADVSACSLFKDASDLPEGDITYANIFDIYKYDNTLYRVPVTGAELKAYMEWSVSYYNQWQPGDINISFNPDIPGYKYDMFSGVDYEIDLSQPVGSRITNVTFKGAPLADDAVLTLAVNNFRYTSTLKATGMVAAERDWESAGSVRDLLVNYFAEHSPVEPTVDGNWRIVGCDLSIDDPRRAEIIDRINRGLLDPPCYAAYNLNDYDRIIAAAKE